jgi:hypothetical protein
MVGNISVIMAEKIFIISFLVDFFLRTSILRMTSTYQVSSFLLSLRSLYSLPAFAELHFYPLAHLLSIDSVVSSMMVLNTPLRFTTLTRYSLVFRTKAPYARATMNEGCDMPH